MSTTGIYKITNKINGKAYIGQSINIELRWKCHKKCFKNKKSSNYNYPLYYAFRKYGVENFLFEIIEECNKEDLNKQEKFWIEYYNTFNEGYNQTLGGDNNSIQIPKKHVLGILKDLEDASLSIKNIANKWSVTVDTVYDINSGTSWYQEKIVYPIRLLEKNKIKPIHKCKICGNPNHSAANICSNCYKKQQAKNIPTKEQLINDLLTYSMLQIGKKYNVSDNAVRKWCKKYELPYKRKDIIEFRNNYNKKGDN